MRNHQSYILAVIAIACFCGAQPRYNVLGLGHQQERPIETPIVEPAPPPPPMEDAAPPPPVTPIPKVESKLQEAPTIPQFVPQAAIEELPKAPLGKPERQLWYFSAKWCRPACPLMEKALKSFASDNHLTFGAYGDGANQDIEKIDFDKYKGLGLDIPWLPTVVLTGRKPDGHYAEFGRIDKFVESTVEAELEELWTRPLIEAPKAKAAKSNKVERMQASARYRASIRPRWTWPGNPNKGNDGGALRALARHLRGDDGSEHRADVDAMAADEMIQAHDNWHDRNGPRRSGSIVGAALGAVFGKRQPRSSSKRYSPYSSPVGSACPNGRCPSRRR